MRGFGPERRLGHAAFLDQGKCGFLRFQFALIGFEIRDGQFHPNRFEPQNRNAGAAHLHDAALAADQKKFAGLQIGNVGDLANWNRAVPDITAFARRPW